jgi:fimbrial chaperone protein
MLRNTFQLVLGLGILFFSHQSYAFRFSPMSATMNLDQKENRLIFNLENESQSPVAIELSLKKRVMNLDGTEEHPALDENSGLSVYPEQLIIPPGQRRSVRVSFSGQAPKSEMAYRLIAEQLPIELEEKDRPVSGIKMLMRYIAAIYIDPGKMKPDVYPLSFKKDDGNLVLTFENKGNKHQLLQNIEISFIKEGTTTLTLEEEELVGLMGENILAHTKREFVLSNIKKLELIDDKHQIQFRLKP